ncbi:MAG: transcriptional regulator, partial [Methylophilaceae bacterium 17-43-7]
MELIDIIKARLSSLEPTTLELIDQSALHIGHAGNTGGGHFQLKIVSSHFSNLSQIARHRMV